MYPAPRRLWKCRRPSGLFLYKRFAPIAIIYFTNFTQENQRDDVLRAVEDDKFDFVPLDTRGREPFANGHTPAAWCAPAEEVDKLIPLLPIDKELVT